MKGRGFSGLACALLVGAFAFPGAAHSDDADALWLARLCVHEATWAGGLPAVNDCGAIMQVVRNRAGERPFRHALRATAPRFAGGTSTRPWARTLHVRAPSAPQDWPEAWPPFAVFDDRWRAVYERSRAFVRGELPPPCSGTPRNWLSRTHPRDRAVAHRYVVELRRWREVDCGETRNAFYEPVPR